MKVAKLKELNKDDYLLLNSKAQAMHQRAEYVREVKKYRVLAVSANGEDLLVDGETVVYKVEHE